MARPKNSLFWIYLAYLGPVLLANTFTAFFVIRSLAFSFTDFLVFLTITFATAMLLCSRRWSVSPRTAFSTAAVLAAVEFLTLAFPVRRELMYLYSILYGTVLCFFWMVYNGAYFLQKPHQQNATRSATYYAIPYVMGVALPVAAVFAVDAFGFTGLYLIGAGGMAGLLYLALEQTKKPMVFDGGSVWNAPTGYRALTFLEGVVSALPLGMIPALSTLFFPTPAEFGGFTAVLGLASVAAMTFLARHSDALSRRKQYLVPLSLLGAVFLAAATTSTNAFFWAVCMAGFGFTFALCSPLRNAVVLDRKQPPQTAMAHREVLLNSGRVCTLALGIALSSSGHPLWAMAPGIAGCVGYAGIAAKKKGVL